MAKVIQYPDNVINGRHPVAIVLIPEAALPPVRAWQRDSVVFAGLEYNVEDASKVGIAVVSQPLQCAPGPTLSGPEEEIEGLVASCSVPGIDIASTVDEVVVVLIT